MKPECKDCEVVENLKKSLMNPSFIYTVLVGLCGGLIWLTANATNLENKVTRNAEKISEQAAQMAEYKADQKEVINTVNQMKLDIRSNGIKIDGVHQAVDRALDRLNKILAVNN